MSELLSLYVLICICVFKFLCVCLFFVFGAIQFLKDMFEIIFMCRLVCALFVLM